MRDRITARKGLTRHEILLVAVLLIFMASVSVMLLLPPWSARKTMTGLAYIVVIETEQGEDHALRMERPPSDGTVIGRLMVYWPKGWKPNSPEWDDAYLVVHPEGEDGLRLYDEDDVEEWQDRLRRLLSALVEQGDEPDGHEYLERYATLPLVPNRR